MILRSCATRPAPWQVGQGLLTVLAGAAALRAGGGDGEEALLPAHLALALAHGAGRGLRAWRGSRPAARLAVLLPRNLDGRFGAPGRFLEGDLEVVAQVGAALRPAPTALAAEHVAEAEHAAEDVGEVAEVVEDRRIEARPAPAPWFTPW